jgi:hypothetical protein
MTDAPVPETAWRIRGEYLELPGLILTTQQVQRLFALDGLTCEAVLAALVDVDFLARTSDGRYVRRDRDATGSGRSVHGAARPAGRRAA